jgi:hypothetical protein
VAVGMAIQEGLAPDPGDWHGILSNLFIVQDGDLGPNFIKLFTTIIYKFL